MNHDIASYSYWYVYLLLQDGETALMLASGGGCTDTLKALLEAKADPNITNKVKLQWIPP